MLRFKMIGPVFRLHRVLSLQNVVNPLYVSVRVNNSSFRVLELLGLLRALIERLFLLRGTYYTVSMHSGGVYASEYRTVGARELRYKFIMRYITEGDKY